MNLEQYATNRVGAFLPASSNGTSQDGDLTGQCVTLEKWIFQDFTDIPNPFSARGHAKDLGKNLVSQGLAYEVSRADSKPGDTVCYEFGEYGHTGTLLEGGRFFQQNANTAGAKRRVLDNGTVVYSATIVPLYSSLGGVAPKFYRLKSFKENTDMNIDEARYEAQRIGLLGHMSEAEITPDWVEYHAKNMVANPSYAAALAKQLYEGTKWQNDVWKAVHFDEEVEKAYKKGLSESGSGNVPAGTYVKVEKENVIEVKS